MMVQMHARAIALVLGPVVALSLQGPQQQEQPILVGGNVRKPERTHFVQPIYPEDAEAGGVQSLVILEMTVDGIGNVSNVTSLRGADIVARAAVEAARLWQYAPTLVEGRAVSVRFSETVFFILRKPRTVPAGVVGGNGMFLRPPAPGASTASYEDWEVEGEAFTACPCTTPCPCRSNAAPSHTPCHATTAQHFSRGHYGEVDLSGMTYVTVGPETWTAIYFDERSTPEQRQAVLDIYASMVPGAPQVYRSVKTVPIDYTTSGDRFSKRVVIPGILELASRMRTGSALMSALGMDVWSNRIFYGDTSVYRYEDGALGEAWDHSGRQSNHKTFTTSKRMYDTGRMLIQHGTGSGSWSDAQNRLMACLR
ncbi:MAG: TonB family protein [Acidobacteria bacterium]|nr:MAG: TonB family protein [Acidobacteriota bacterium]